MARAFGNLDALMGATEAELAAVDGIGAVIAASVMEFLAMPTNQTVLARLRAAGVAAQEPGAGGSGPANGTTAGAGDQGPVQSLAGLTMVVTGSVPGYTREEAEEAILFRGGKSPGSVSKKTFALVVGDAPGASKLKKAEELDIPIVPADRFESLLDSGTLPDDRRNRDAWSNWASGRVSTGYTQ